MLINLLQQKFLTILINYLLQYTHSVRTPFLHVQP